MKGWKPQPVFHHRMPKDISELAMLAAGMADDVKHRRHYLHLLDEGARRFSTRRGKSLAASNDACQQLVRPPPPLTTDLG